MKSKEAFIGTEDSMERMGFEPIIAVHGIIQFKNIQEN